MTTATQQLPSNPALDFANAVLEETDYGREIINMLHDIARGHRENSTANDRIAASKTLLDRGLGKCPRQPLTLSEAEPSRRAEETGDTDVGALREAPTAKPDSPRLVTQLDDALNDALGPPPSAQNPLSLEGEGWGEGEKNVFDPLSIHFFIQQHILEITNNCRTINTALTDILRAPEDDRKVTDYHRVRAGQMLLDRVLGTNPGAFDVLGLAGNCPQCSYVLSSPCPEHSRTVQDDSDSEEFVPDPGWIETLHEIKRMEDEGIIDKVEYDPFNPKSRMTGTEEEIAPYASEIAAKYMAELDLQAERRARRPEIEERRRKKLAELYPSHSEDGDPPET